MFASLTNAARAQGAVPSGASCFPQHNRAHTKVNKQGDLENWILGNISSRWYLCQEFLQVPVTWLILRHKCVCTSRF